ncbi:MAG TPA: hypothetical protein PKA37_05805 [Planctomycetota bacterium]|mgnify:FL=1|nr:hypothetical protein [Planctomycetota bacterium]
MAGSDVPPRGGALGDDVTVLFLIDSNIAIASEPLSVNLEVGAGPALQFL